MLEQVAHFNDLSPKLRAKLTQRIDSFGKEVKYRFNISHENPDPEKYNGPIIWPSIYTLDPKVLNVLDNDEDRKDKSKAKRIGIVKEIDEKGAPKSFRPIRVRGQYAGILTLDLTTPEGREEAAMMELHPKVEGSFFRDERLLAVVHRIDETKEATEAIKLRKQRKKAMEAASGMAEKELRDFAAAMNWNENENPDILRNKMEEHAEKYPGLFTGLIEGNLMKYQSTVKMALTQKVLSYDPVGGRWTYTENGELIVLLPPNGSQNELEQMAEFLSSNGEKGETIFKRIKALTK